MEEPDVFDAIRQEGIDADDPEVRESVRVAFEHVEAVRARTDDATASRCMRAMSTALTYQLQHPDVGDMSRFESEFGSDN